MATTTPIPVSYVKPVNYDSTLAPLKLAPFDDSLCLRILLREVYAYEVNLPVSLLKESLATTLQYFHPLAGRLRNGENNHLEVYWPQENEEGVDVGAAFSTATYTGAETVAQVFGKRQPGEFPSDFDFLWGDHPLHSKAFRGIDGPLLSVHHTTFQNGSGCALGILIHHALVDAKSMNDFMNFWTSVTRKAELPPLPVHTRCAGYTPEGDSLGPVPHPEYVCIPADFTSPPITYPPTTIRMIHFSPEKIKEMKETAHTHSLTTNDVLTAHLWREITRVRLETGTTKRGGGPVYFLYPMDARSKFQPPLGDNYFGVGAVYCMLNAPSAEVLVEDLSLAEVAQLVHNETARCSQPAWLKSTYEYLQDHQAKGSLCRLFFGCFPFFAHDFMLSSWTRNKMFSTSDFLGQPASVSSSPQSPELTSSPVQPSSRAIYAGPYDKSPTDGFGVLSNDPEEKGIDVFLSMRSEHMPVIESRCL